MDHRLLLSVLLLLLCPGLKAIDPTPWLTEESIVQHYCNRSHMTTDGKQTNPDLITCVGFDFDGNPSTLKEGGSGCLNWKWKDKQQWDRLVGKPDPVQWDVKDGTLPDYDLLGERRKLCDVIFVLNKGRFVFLNSIKDYYNYTEDRCIFPNGTRNYECPFRSIERRVQMLLSNEPIEWKEEGYISGIKWTDHWFMTMTGGYYDMSTVATGQFGNTIKVFLGDFLDESRDNFYEHRHNAFDDSKKVDDYYSIEPVHYDQGTFDRADFVFGDNEVLVFLVGNHTQTLKLREPMILQVYAWSWYAFRTGKEQAIPDYLFTSEPFSIEKDVRITGQTVNYWQQMASRSASSTALIGSLVPLGVVVLLLVVGLIIWFYTRRRKSAKARAVNPLTGEFRSEWPNTVVIPAGGQVKAPSQVPAKNSGASKTASKKTKGTNSSPTSSVKKSSKKKTTKTPAT